MEKTMSTKIRAYLTFTPAGRTLIIGLLITLAMAVIAGFGGIQTENVIARPGLRMLDWLWQVFLCRCGV